ncbi:MAG: RsfA family transcriptional regulator [Bacillota bacterium]|uniref:RsfA family transcriptional regulator n=1 Tax=Virgibacillus TaxID=84406 RepID=UPI0003FBCB39|nr:MULTISPECIES: RsfA family transcriptional regulator [Bacillaceae]MCC2249616.1 RsfA family transcriptional regulator [Virgibacillus sp. AGTR]MDY7044196.1 RsfA family transcriptional regulator [Virgibacillus sp. M23]QRZ16863.1 RsfA family transcriptional regulator [Virgibacillus sp. AGTR]WBX79661.1 RsfA family transcriptional regulator [Virgibacillus salarius]
MNATRQDAWTKDEDVLLAETVLRYIRDGKTQLEAFKEVAKKLSRTSAACGFRWNATIRKQYQDAIQTAKEERKLGNRKDIWSFTEPKIQERDTIETAILLLEKMRSNFSTQKTEDIKNDKEYAEHLEKENAHLKEKLTRYENAWEEMGKLWSWVKTDSQDK